MNSGKDFSDAMQKNYEERQQAARDGIGGVSSGGGIGNIGGWLVFAIMIGAILGFIMGQGAVGALVGAVVFAALIWVPVAFLKRSGGGVSRIAVILWTLGGGVMGVIAAIGVALVWDIAFLEELRVENMMVTYGLLGAAVMGGYKLSRR